MLNYDQHSYESITLRQKINEIKFPNNVPNSPYSIKQLTPATPISLMMELKTWLKQNLKRVSMIEELGVSTTTFEFIQNSPIEEERRKVASFIQTTFKACIESVIEYMSEKEGKKEDTKLMEVLMR